MRRCPQTFWVVLGGAVLGCISAGVEAEPASEEGLERFDAVMFTGYYTTDDEFDAFATTAKELGGTHVTISAGLPLAMWQYDTPGDPYPAWMEQQVGLLEVFPPDALRAHIPEAYSSALVEALDSRADTLGRLGMKARFATNAPQVAPESVFEERPLWRGPRVDHTLRSRVARFALNVDDPEVLDLYRESVADLVEAFPQIEVFTFLTTDSGSGLSWSPGLYPGANGNTLYRDRPMFDRVYGFLQALREGAEAGGGRLDIRVLPIKPTSWMVPSFDNHVDFAKRFEAGLAMGNAEGPDGRPFVVAAGIPWEWNFFFPVIGIEQPLQVVRGLSAAAESEAPRLHMQLDPWTGDLYATLFARFWESPVSDEIGRLELLREVAVDRVGEDRADALLAAWIAVDDAVKCASALRVHLPLMTGGVHQRWLSRPLVPLPELLTDEETAHYDRFLFQAREDEHARNYTDLQATQVYSGWQGKFFVEEITYQIDAQLKLARKHLADVTPGLSGPMKERYELLDLRLRAAGCMVANLRNFSSFQGQLDRVKALGVEPEFHPVLGTQSNWDRTLMIDTARAEADNTAVLINILERASGPVILTADAAEDERIRQLGPELVQQLRAKLKVMNARWNDYDHVFTRPNP